jgi:hypothetical protein
VDAAVKVRTLLPLPGAAIVEGEKAAVTPAGIPVALSVTLEFNAKLVAEVKVIVPVPPGSNEIDEAEAENVSVGTATVTVTAAELVSEPPVATMFTL